MTVNAGHRNATARRSGRRAASLVAVLSVVVAGLTVTPAAATAAPGTAAAESSDVRVGVLALAGAIAAVGRTPELAGTLPFTRTSVADVLRLDDVVTSDLTDALAGTDLATALGEVRGIRDVEVTDGGDTITFGYAQHGDRAAAARLRRRRPAVRRQRGCRGPDRQPGHPGRGNALRGPRRPDPDRPAAEVRARQPAPAHPRRLGDEGRRRAVHRTSGVHRRPGDRRSLPGPAHGRHHPAGPGRARAADARGPALLHAPGPLPDHPHPGPGRHRLRPAAARLGGRRRGRLRGRRGRPARHVHADRSGLRRHGLARPGHRRDPQLRRRPARGDGAVPGRRHHVAVEVHRRGAGAAGRGGRPLPEPRRRHRRPVRTR